MDKLVTKLIDAASDIVIHWPLGHKAGPDRCECNDCERLAELRRAITALDPQVL